MKSSSRTKTHQQAEYRLSAMHAIFQCFNEEFKGYTGLKEALEYDDINIFPVLESENISFSDSTSLGAINVFYVFEGEQREDQIPFRKIDSFCSSFQEVFDQKGIENIN